LRYRIYSETEKGMSGGVDRTVLDYREERIGGRREGR